MASTCIDAVTSAPSVAAPRFLSRVSSAARASYSVRAAATGSGKRRRVGRGIEPCQLGLEIRQPLGQCLGRDAVLACQAHDRVEPGLELAETCGIDVQTLAVVPQRVHRLLQLDLGRFECGKHLRETGVVRRELAQDATPRHSPPTARQHPLPRASRGTSPPPRSALPHGPDGRGRPATSATRPDLAPAGEARPPATPDVPVRRPPWPTAPRPRSARQQRCASPDAQRRPSLQHPSRPAKSSSRRRCSAARMRDWCSCWP